MIRLLAILISLLILNLSCGDDQTSSGDSIERENAAQQAVNRVREAATMDGRPQNQESESANGQTGSESGTESGAESGEGRTQSETRTAADQPDISPSLKNFVDSYDFTSTGVVLPSHDVLGEIQAPFLMSQQEKRMYDILSRRDYWQEVDFQVFGLANPPRAPFRSVNIFSIYSLGNSRFDIACELRSFESTHFLQIVVYYDGNSARIVHIAGLNGTGEEGN